jgi:hypothetical protein
MKNEYRPIEFTPVSQHTTARPRAVSIRISLREHVLIFNCVVTTSYRAGHHAKYPGDRQARTCAGILTTILLYIPQAPSSRRLTHSMNL